LSPEDFSRLSHWQGPEIAMTISQRDGGTFVCIGDVSGAIGLPTR
jgi:hypothetical protein